MKIILSFDIEEFDMPLEYNGTISFAEQIEVSRRGLIKILELLKKRDLKATFYSTVVFAKENADLIKNIIDNAHELASHTWYHSKFDIQDLKKSRNWLSEKFNVEVSSLRMPRMMEIPASDVAAAGYKYNSSINPTFLPGRYNNFSVSRQPFSEGRLIQFPASVATFFRIPLFWLSFHNFPLSVYQFLVKRSLAATGFCNIYFHPWEFADCGKHEYQMPSFAVKNSGELMARRFEKFLDWAVSKNYEFMRTDEFLMEKFSK